MVWMSSVMWYTHCTLAWTKNFNFYIFIPACSNFYFPTIILLFFNLFVSIIHFSSFFFFYFFPISFFYSSSSFYIFIFFLSCFSFMSSFLSFSFALPSLLFPFSFLHCVFLSFTSPKVIHISPHFHFLLYNVAFPFVFLVHLKMHC